MAFKAVLIDADVLMYRCAWSEKDSSAEEAILKTDELVSNILGEVDPWGESMVLYFLTGKGNFRYEVAKTAPYKGNRKDLEKPKNLDIIRNHFIDNYFAIESNDCEADDLIGICAEVNGYDNVVIVSIDKDFEQIPTTIFNPTKWEWKTVDPWTATKNFYKQVLTGDRVDNIIGLKGVGPVTADNILSTCDSEKALYNACVDAYAIQNDYENAKERVLENARLLWIQRNPCLMWEPPK